MGEKSVLAGRTETDWYVKRAGTICTLRAAALIIKDDRFLAAKSTDYDCYYTVGGGIEINETSEEAVIREVYEETGCKLEIERLVELNEAREHRRSQQIVLTAFMDTIEKSERVYETFDEVLWQTIVQKATVHLDGRIVFTFSNGQEIEG